METAIRLFSEKGFRGATTRDLAAAAGVTEPVLYQHFATKGDLYAALIEHKSQRGLERFAARLEPYFARNDDAGFFTTLAEVIFDWHREDPEYVRLLLFSGLEGHELSDLFYERHTREFFARLSGYISRRIKEGAFRAVDPMIAARAFTCMVVHYNQQCIIFSRARLRASQSRIVETMVSIFLKGLKP